MCGRSTNRFSIASASGAGSSILGGGRDGFSDLRSVSNNSIRQPALMDAIARRLERRRRGGL